VLGQEGAPARAQGVRPALPGPVERSDGRPGRSGARAGRGPGRGRDHLASGRLRRSRGAGCLIRAPGARSRATGPRLGPARPIGPRASAKASESSLRRAWHHQIGGRPHGPSGPGRGRAGRLEASFRPDAPDGPSGPRRPLGALGISAGGPPSRRGTEGPERRKGAPRAPRSAPGRARRGSRACAKGSRAQTGGGCEASAPTGGQGCAAARAVRRDDNGGRTGRADLGLFEMTADLLHEERNQPSAFSRSGCALRK
jgi:hypothetical protein